ncbi:hypothetical protein [Rhodoplanes azumiensis]|uniref:Uncharacterized protein n=1 Tax=Rhodoplanes azumiensis TaxID=1897628 RepID=A0ABW5ALE9_9BRAD
MDMPVAGGRQDRCFALFLIEISFSRFVRCSLLRTRSRIPVEASNRRIEVLAAITAPGPAAFADRVYGWPTGDFAMPHPPESLPPELRHASIICDEAEALSTLNRALSTSGYDHRAAGLVCGLLAAKAAVVAVSRTTGEVIVGFHRLETPHRKRWFRIGEDGMDFVWESDGESTAGSPTSQ